MKRISWALGAAAVLALTVLVPSASASVVPTRHYTTITTVSGGTGPQPAEPTVTESVDTAGLVTLGQSFSPSSLVAKVGQLIVVVVSGGVTANVTSPVPGASIAGGELDHSRIYLYVATHPGLSTIVATVRPVCAHSEGCPQWMTMPKLNVTVAP
jgi:hypothetical protein